MASSTPASVWASAAPEPALDDAASGRGDLWLRFRRSRNAQAGALLVLLVAMAALFGPWLAPYRYADTDLLAVWAEPSREHWLGGDGLGRDILSRLVVGARVSLLVALSVLAITLMVGITTGMVAGYFGGWLDGLLMRGADLVFAFPELIFAILVAAMLGPGTLTVILALSLVWWPGIARLARSLTLALKTEPFVEAAVTCGTPPLVILGRHLLPNLVAPLIVRASVGVGFIIMAEATLSFLGIGVQEPLPTWGGMIRDGLPALRTEPYLALGGSAALGLSIIGFNLLGDGLRDILDPRIRDR
jgi:ABC-type dipeptide/oligopeptide/nickel transport system permease subunit